MAYWTDLQYQTKPSVQRSGSQTIPSIITGGQTIPALGDSYHQQQHDIDAANAQKAQQSGVLANWSKGAQNQNFGNVKDYLGVSNQNAENLAAGQNIQANYAADTDWFQQQRKLASAMNALASAAPGGTTGSAQASMWDVATLQDDIGDVDVRQALRQNKESIYNSLYESLAANDASLNEAAAATEANRNAISGDLAAQQINLGTATQNLFNGMPAYDNFYDENKVGPRIWENIGYTMSDENFKSGQPLDSDGDNSRAGAANKNYAIRQKQGYERR